MQYQYHCACCNKAVSSTDTSCPNCGSHSIRSPYSFWMLCLLACLAASVVFKVVHVSSQAQQDVPTKDTIFNALQLEVKQSS